MTLVITTLLLRLIILDPLGAPIRGAWVEVSGMAQACDPELGECYYVEQTTDSRGVFIVEVESGSHTVHVTKQGYVPYQDAVVVSLPLQTHTVYMVKFP